ncbi:MAG TPA: zinc-binding dehydrogenase [Chloroflexota bacterium]
MNSASGSMTMRGVILPGHQRVELREFPIPKPGPGQVLLRMRASGLCGSDLRAIYYEHTGAGAERYQGCIAGHEPAGEVEAVGAGVRGLRPGDRVVVYHIVGCGRCWDCHGGWMINCSSPERAAYGWQRDGGHADFLLAEAQTLLPLPDELSYVDGALVACGFGTAHQAVLRAAVTGADRVLVVGLGPVGLGATMLAAARGAEVIGIDLKTERLELARQAGASHCFSAGDALARIMDLARGQGVEVSIDCSGSAAGRLLCLEAAREWGRVVYVGEGGAVTFEPSPLLLHKQLTLHGSWVTGLREMQDLLELLVRKRLHPETTVTHRFPLAEAQEAYRLFATGSTGKVVLTLP